MVDIIDQAFDALYKRVMEMPNKVLDIFNNFFGEERVDMQGFPSKVELTNSVLRMTTEDLFTKAGMISKLPIEGVSLEEELEDVINNLSEEKSMAAIIKVLLSLRLAEYYKERENGFILVHFPRTVVTNEYDKSTVVNHIYIKVPIAANGTERGLFTMNRSEYTVAEMYSNYMHSHANNIPTKNFRNFASCCLGSGPLRNTQANLSVSFDEDRWNLFCLELSKYVEVESIDGTPYHYLERISLDTFKVLGLDRLANYSGLDLTRRYPHNLALRETLMNFFNYYLDNNNLTFSFRNGVYSIGISFTEYLIHISNSFIEWVNKQPSLKPLKGVFNKVMGDYLIKGGEVYQRSTDVDRYLQTCREYIGQEICTFKGKPVTISITDIDMNKDINFNNAKLLHPPLASKLLNRILTTLNYRYGRNQEDPSTVTGKVRYKI